MLKYMFMPVMSKVEPIGLVPMFNEIDIKDPKLKKAWNYDVTVECPGHVIYKEGSTQILDRIEYSF